MNNVNKEKILKNVEKGHETASFAKGWFIAYATLPECRMLELQAKIMLALGKVNNVTFYRRLIGVTVPNIYEAKALQEVFNEFGIDKVFYESVEDYEADLRTVEQK